MSLRLMYSPIFFRNIAQVLLLNHLPSQDLESGDTTRRGKKLSLLEFDENLQFHSANYAKRVEDLFRGLVGLRSPNHSLTGRGDSENEITFRM